MTKCLFQQRHHFYDKFCSAFYANKSKIFCNASRPDLLWQPTKIISGEGTAITALEKQGSRLWYKMVVKTFLVNGALGS